jgi:hypothetical protein
MGWPPNLCITSHPPPGMEHRQTMGMETDLTTLKSDVRDCLENEIGNEVTVEFVEDANRIDVRIKVLGIGDELQSRHDDLTVSTWGEHRLTVQMD